MPLITHDIINIIEKRCDDHQLNLPENFRSELINTIGLVGRINSFLKLKNQVCKPIKEGLKNNPEINEIYSDIFKIIKDDVRFDLAIALGFQKIVIEPGRKNGPSIRQILINYIQSLDDGESWNGRQLSMWSIGGKKMGKSLYNKIWNMMTVDKRAIETILGEGAEEILKNNPFEVTVVQHIKTKDEAKAYLIEFLMSLKKGQKWNYKELREWSSGQVQGDYLAERIKELSETNSFNKKALKTILGKDYNKYLKRSPHDPNREILNVIDARKLLKKFLETLEPNEEWNTTKLRSWANSEGSTSGMGLFSWIERNIANEDNEVNIDHIKTTLGKRADELLERNPFNHKKITIRNQADVRRIVLLFIQQALTVGEPWSQNNLRQWSLGDENGANVIGWINKHLRSNNETWEEVISNLIGPEMLTKNPYIPHFGNTAEGLHKSAKKKDAKPLAQKSSRTLSNNGINEDSQTNHQPLIF